MGCCGPHPLQRSAGVYACPPLLACVVTQLDTHGPSDLSALAAAPGWVMPQERAAAELKQRWRTQQHVTLSPTRIGDIAHAALVLYGIWK